MVHLITHYSSCAGSTEAKTSFCEISVMLISVISLLLLSCERVCTCCDSDYNIRSSVSDCPSSYGLKQSTLSIFSLLNQHFLVQVLNRLVHGVAHRQTWSHVVGTFSALKCSVFSAFFGGTQLNSSPPKKKKGRKSEVKQVELCSADDECNQYQYYNNYCN